MQHVEQLAFVFVDPFHLDVEQGVRVDDNAAVSGNNLGEPFFVDQFHRLPALVKTRVVAIGLEAAELVEVDRPNRSRSFRR